MDVNSLLKTVTRQRRSCDLNPGPPAPQSSTLTTPLPSHPHGKHHKSVECPSVSLSVCSIDRQQQRRGRVCCWSRAQAADIDHATCGPRKFSPTVRRSPTTCMLHLPHPIPIRKWTKKFKLRRKIRLYQNIHNPVSLQHFLSKIIFGIPFLTK